MLDACGSILEAQPASPILARSSPQCGLVGLIDPMWAGRGAVAGAVVNAAYVYGNNIQLAGGNGGRRAEWVARIPWLFCRRRYQTETT
jgi:hypothetical protein